MLKQIYTRKEILKESYNENSVLDFAYELTIVDELDKEFCLEFGNEIVFLKEVRKIVSKE